MAMFKIYVGNLDYKVTVEDLRPMFEPFGDLDEITIAVDAEGKSRGFAIVLFKDKLKGQLAIETLTDRKILGRPIFINEALKKGKKLSPEAKEKPVRQGPFGPKFRGDGSRPMGGPRTTATPRLGGSGGSRPSSSRNPRRVSGSSGGPGFRGAPEGKPPMGAAGSFPSGNVRPPRPAARPGGTGTPGSFPGNAPQVPPLPRDPNPPKGEKAP
ncbi:MAG: hypothetical protein K8R92_02000 [Planctomycetes bacterium]|nr:hypothetical protein [Planctomycetota bacterium]